MSDRDDPLQPATFSTEDQPHSGPLTAEVFEPLSHHAGNKPDVRKSVRRIVIAAAVVVIAAVLFFLLTARSLGIVVNTETPAAIEIDGLAVAVGDRWLVRPGDYVLRVSAAGYAPWQETISVTAADSQQITVSPAILPGKVTVTSNPSGASVNVDGKALGTTPITGLLLPAGKATVDLILPRYQQRTETVTITGREVAQTLAFELQPDWAYVTLITQPGDAVIRVDDQVTQRNIDATLTLLSGQRILEISAPGFETARREIAVQAGVPQTLDPIRLKPADGVLQLTSQPSGANVSVNGEFRGQTPLDLALRPDRSHDISITLPGYQRDQLTVALERGSVRSQTITLTPRLGDIVFDISPADAELVIDGRVVGLGGQTLALTAVEHRVAVQREGYASWRGRVVPREGLAQRLAVALVTEADARKAALTPEITTALGQTLRLIDPLSAPKNTFTLGASRRDPGRRSNETLRTVTLDRAFYIATTETTNAQFRQFLASHDSGQLKGNSLNREHQPAVTMSWQQAARFCNWLSNKEGLAPFYQENAGIIVGFNPESTGYRLPSEAEWAYVARVDGDALRRFAWGEQFPPDAAVTNVADNTSAFVTGRILNGYADGHIVSAPVASYPANHRGLYDLGGNVAEWVHDVYSVPAPSSEPQVNPLGAAKGDNYTVRGASWKLSRLAELRLTYRDYGASGRDDIGFRIARYAE